MKIGRISFRAIGYFVDFSNFEKTGRCSGGKTKKSPKGAEKLNFSLFVEKNTIEQRRLFLFFLRLVHRPPNS